MTVREDIEDARNEINDIKNNNDAWATIILHDYKRDKILFFVMWIITFIALVGAVFYIVHLYEDITTVETVGELSGMYKDNIILMTMPGHISTAKFGTVYDIFDCRNYLVEYAWLVL